MKVHAPEVKGLRTCHHRPNTTDVSRVRTLLVVGEEAEDMALKAWPGQVTVLQSAELCSYLK